MPSASRIQENLQRVQERIAAAALRAGRKADEVTLVAVTKYVDVQDAACLLAAGCRDLGESRPQELWRKAEALTDPRLRWHLIGHLQRNKLARTLPLVTHIHSVDSERLLRAIDETARTLDRDVSCFLEVNIAREPQKHGFTSDQIAPLVPLLGQLARTRVVGLMAMARQADDPEQARDDFRALRFLQQDLQQRFPGRPYFAELSMGMSGDYEIAIEEGSHYVRVGSALFADGP